MKEIFERLLKENTAIGKKYNLDKDTIRKLTQFETAFIIVLKENK